MVGRKMANITELKARLEFWKVALTKKRTAYLALVDGGVKSYTLDGRDITKFDLDVLSNEIEHAEKKVDELTAMIKGKRPRKAFSVIPRNW